MLLFLIYSQIKEHLTLFKYIAVFLWRFCLVFAGFVAKIQEKPFITIFYL